MITQAVRPSLTAFNSEKPLVLVTDYAPDADGGGAVILRSLLSSEDRKSIVWMSPSPNIHQETSSPHVFSLRSGSAGRGRRSIAMDTVRYPGRLARTIIDEADARGATAFWVVMHNAAVPIAARLIRESRRPVHLTVHDDPAFANAFRSTRYLALVPLIERDFAFSLKNAASVDVISEGMARRYARRHGIHASIVHRALDEPIQPSPPYDNTSGELRVGVLGSTYSYGQLPRLARAVEMAAHGLGLTPRLLIVGRSHGERLSREFASRVEVDVTGHLSEAEAIPLLRDCFLLYVNYPFGWRDAVLRQTSFPTKLSTYIQAARPLLIHAPLDSSIMPLVGSDQYAFPWGSLDPAQGSQVLMNAWKQGVSHESRHVEADRVRREYYNPDRNRRSLFDALNQMVKRNA